MLLKKINSNFTIKDIDITSQVNTAGLNEGPIYV